jgi:hypothetical protein
MSDILLQVPVAVSSTSKQVIVDVDRHVERTTYI